MRVRINETRTEKLPVSELAYHNIRTCDPAMLSKGVVEFVLVRVVYHERDSSIRFNPQDGARNVFDGRGSQGVDQGPDENPPRPACTWHGRVGELRQQREESKQEAYWPRHVRWLIRCLMERAPGVLHTI